MQIVLHFLLQLHTRLEPNQSSDVKTCKESKDTFVGKNVLSEISEYMYYYFTCMQFLVVRTICYLWHRVL